MRAVGTEKTDALPRQISCEEFYKSFSNFCHLLPTFATFVFKIRYFMNSRMTV